jgi:hypothetical protein
MLLITVYWIGTNSLSSRRWLIEQLVTMPSAPAGGRVSLSRQ